MHLFDEIDEGLSFSFDLWEEPLVTTDTSIVDSARNEPFTTEEYAAWRQHEYAGYPAEDNDPDALVADGDDDDAPMVREWQLKSDRATLAHLRRSWLGLYRDGPDGSRVVKGAHPFSSEEGSAEWLERVRAQLREEYRSAGSDRERSAIQSREAALRARHNARCFARCIARYFSLDEREVLTVLDGRQKEEPIGWLGLESVMRCIFDSLADDYQERLAVWNAAFSGKWSQVQKDEWLDRMPQPPEHPTQLVTSAKKLRPHKKVERETAPPVIDGPVLSKVERDRLKAERLKQHRAELLAKLDALRHAPRVSRGNLRFLARDSVSLEWDVRKEWERAEMVEPQKLTVPESLPMHNLTGDLQRDFARLNERLAAHHAERVLREASATRYLGTAA